jgi:hypothetical protein
MIRAFAPGMTMQEPLPQAASPFDVRNEPTAPESEPPIADPNDTGGEVARLEQLLRDQTRERRELAQELERRSALLRDACTRLTELGPKVAEAASEHAVRAIRDERDAAVARAVEAEVARAEATFRVDELMGQLLGTGRTLEEIGPGPVERALTAKVADLEEQKQMADARLLLLEDELAQERAHSASIARERVEANERLEFELGQSRLWAETAQLKLAELLDARGALLGERDGLRARMEEAERALGAAQERLSRASRQGVELKDKLETERAERATQLTRTSAQSLQLEELRAELERVRRERAEAQTSNDALEASLGVLRDEIERERAQNADGASALVAREAELEELRAELERERSHSSARKVGLAEIEATLAEVQAEVETKQLQIAASTKALAARDAELAELREALEAERAARGTLETQLAAARVPASVREAAQQEQLETLRACLLELRLPLLELDSELSRIAQGKSRSSEAGDTARKIIVDMETLSALDEQIRQKDLKIEELEAALAAEQKARIAAQSMSPAERDARVIARDQSVATLKGELIDVRANATRLSDDLTRERARRRKMAVTVRALQAASESGESLGPWIEELLSLINEGTSLPPKSERP